MAAWKEEAGRTSVKRAVCHSTADGHQALLVTVPWVQRRMAQATASSVLVLCEVLPEDICS